jgi:hypothetical protein
VGGTTVVVVGAGVFGTVGGTEVVVALFVDVAGGATVVVGVAGADVVDVDTGTMMFCPSALLNSLRPMPLLWSRSMRSNTSLVAFEVGAVVGATVGAVVGAWVGAEVDPGVNES